MSGMIELLRLLNSTSLRHNEVGDDFVIHDGVRWLVVPVPEIEADAEALVERLGEVDESIERPVVLSEGEVFNTSRDNIAAAFKELAPAAAASSDFTGWRGFVFTKRKVLAFNVASGAVRDMRTPIAFAVRAEVAPMLPKIRVSNGLVASIAPDGSGAFIEPMPRITDDAHALLERIEDETANGGSLIERAELTAFVRKAQGDIDLFVEDGSLRLVADEVTLSLPSDAPEGERVRVKNSYLAAGLRMMSGTWVELALADLLLIVLDDETDYALAGRRLEV